MDAAKFNARIESLIHAWCDRRELRALAGLLPSWLYNNGLTDGWEELAASLRTTSKSDGLPARERGELRELWIELDAVLRNR
jgi:hypothetical protein